MKYSEGNTPSSKELFILEFLLSLGAKQRGKTNTPTTLQVKLASGKTLDWLKKRFLFLIRARGGHRNGWTHDDIDDLAQEVVRNLAEHAQNNPWTRETIQGSGKALLGTYAKNALSDYCVERCTVRPPRKQRRKSDIDQQSTSKARIPQSLAVPFDTLTDGDTNFLLDDSAITQMENQNYLEVLLQQLPERDLKVALIVKESVEHGNSQKQAALACGMTEQELNTRKTALRDQYARIKRRRNF